MLWQSSSDPTRDIAPYCAVRRSSTRRGTCSAGRRNALNSRAISRKSAYWHRRVVVVPHNGRSLSERRCARRLCAVLFFVRMVSHFFFLSPRRNANVTVKCLRMSSLCCVAVAHAAQAGRRLTSVTPLGLNGGNRNWLARWARSIVFDKSATSADRGLGGSLAVELAFAIDDPVDLLGVDVNDPWLGIPRIPETIRSPAQSPMAL